MQLPPLGHRCLIGLSFFIALVLAMMVMFMGEGVAPEKLSGKKESRVAPTLPEMKSESTALVAKVKELPVPPAGSVKVVSAPENAPDAIVAFRDWARDYFLAEPNDRAAMIEEGKVLAKAHTLEVAKMISVDPKKAIESAVPMVVRQDLPKEIVELLEERINSKGALSLMAATPDYSSPDLQMAPYHHIFKPVGGETRFAYVYGARAMERSLKETMVNGISAAPIANGVKIVAIAESRVRALEVGERPDPAKARISTCPVSGKSTAPKVQAKSAISEATPAFEDQTTVHYVCASPHIDTYSEGLVKAETEAHWAAMSDNGSTVVDSGTIVATGAMGAMGATGGPIAPFAVPTNWTTGVRRVLYLRVTFPDHNQDPQSESEAYSMMKEVGDEITAMSYGRTYIQTTVAPLLVVSRTEAWLTQYQAEGGPAYNIIAEEALVLAKAAGYDQDAYDLVVTRWNGPVGSWGGLASVNNHWMFIKVSQPNFVVHEMGHCFGLWHSQAFKGNPGNISGPGYTFDYLNYWDWMGSGSDEWYEGGHFVAPAKAELGWLPRGSQALAQQSGTYQIYQSNQPLIDPAKRYALRVKKDVERDYWFEFRPTQGSNVGVENGLMTTFDSWGGSKYQHKTTGSNRGPSILDMTPGSWSPSTIDTRLDGMLVVGRTFTDTETNTSVTPIAKRATTPPSMDVVVNIGPFATNRAPTQSLSLPPAIVNVGDVVNFTSDASDPDLDPLAYAWDFGDSTFSVNNSATQSKSWSTVGHYVVRCTVSDMKGKVHTAQRLVTVGTPTTYTISGKVRGPDLAPIEGVQVANQTIELDPFASAGNFNTVYGFRHPKSSNYRSSYTDSAGDYILTGIAGPQTLYASLYPYTFTATFANPLAVSANVVGADWNSTALLPTLSIQAVNTSASESGTTGSFRITRTGSITSDLLVQVLTPAGSATRNTDYTLSPPFAAYTTTDVSNYFKILAGNASLDITLIPVNDSLSEGEETATLTLANLTLGYRVVGSNEATVRILDNESALPAVGLASLDTLASEPNNGATLQLTRSGDITASLTVNLAYTGAAGLGVDYSAPTSVTIPAGQSSVLLPITILSDSTSEGTETVTVSLATGSTYKIAGNATSVTFELNDYNIQTVSIEATDPNASEAALDPGLFTITRSGSDLSAALIVDYAVNGSAGHGNDYARLEGRATIAAGETSTSIRISPYDDQIGEGNQSVTLTLRSDGRYQIGNLQSATITISDNDLPNMTALTLSGARTEPATGSSTAKTFRIQRAQAGAPITVNYTMSGTATSGDDYTALSGSIAFTASDTFKDIDLNVLSDTNIDNFEDSETVVLTLGSGAGYQIAAYDKTATAKILDSDRPQIAVTAAVRTISPSSVPPTVRESDPEVIFSIARNTNPGVALTVNYTMSGTATSETDYKGATGSVIIPAGAFSANVELPIEHDTVAEGAETVTLTITPIAAYGLRTPDATILIADDDTFSGAPTVGFVTSTSAVAESSPTLSIPVTVSGTFSGNVSVRYAISGGTANLSDVELPAGTLTFTAPGTKYLVLNIWQDIFPEPAETVEITLSHAYRAVLATAINVVTITNVGQPEAFTRSPSDILATTATLNGAGIPHGLDSDAYFEWGTTTSYGTKTATQSLGSGQVEAPVTQSISGLSSGQTYHYRVVVTNDAGISYGNDRLIVMPAPPDAVTLAATNRTRNSAQLNGTVDPNARATNAWFQWGTTISYGSATTIQAVGSGSSVQAVNASIGNLVEGTTYHFRMVAESSEGMTYGSDQTFTPASLTIAGDLSVNLRASNGTAGSATWGSSGTLADFAEVGDATLVADVAGTGIPGVLFNGTSAAYNGPTTVSDIHGASDRTIETWFFNPAGEVTDETLVNLGRQGNNRSLLSVCAGSSRAVNLWSEGANWVTVPSYGQWHHLAMVYDGATTIAVYVDGAFVLNRTLAGSLSSTIDPIILGCSRDISGNIVWGNRGLNGYLNTVRIHGGQLSAAQVLSNYEYGPATIALPEVFTRAASSVLADRFTANGSVEPNGQETSAWIEYGPTTAYGSQTAETIITAAAAPLEISTLILGSGNTTYHYRVVAQNASGKVFGEDVSVTTSNFTAPTLVSLSPSDGATGVTLGSSFVATFSENIAVGTGSITLKNLSDGGLPISIAVTDSTQVTISGATITINPSVNLLASKNYAIQIPAGAIKDTAGNAFAGILNDTTWNFTSAGLDHFAISAIGSPQTVGTPIAGITLIAQDAANNTITNFSGSVTFGGTAGISGTSAAFTAGVLSGVSVTPTVAGSNLTFTVSDGASHTGSATIATIAAGYTISYAGNTSTGGTAPSNQLKTHNVNLTVSGPGTLVRTGYTFVGWNTAANGTGVSYAAGATYNVNASVTLYAQWNAKPTVSAGVDQSVVLTNAIWSPSDLGPLAWYDASDSTTVTQVGGAVSQWADKAGTSHMVQGTSGKQPLSGSTQINGLNSISFDGTDDALKTASNPFGASISNAMLIGVFNVGTINTGATLFSLTGSSNSTNRWQSHAPWSDGTLYFDSGNDTGTNRLATASGFSANQNKLLGFYSSTTANVQQVWVDGNSLVSDATGHTVSTAGGIALGHDGTSSFDNCRMGEVLVVNGTVSASNREKLEGYLAQKWGLTGSLPVVHPYKSQSPTNSTVVANISGTVSDANGDPLTTIWTVISGPGEVSFSNINAAATTATFTVAGTYTLRLTASDPGASTADDIAITVNAPAPVVDHFAISGIGSSQTVGTPITGITITAKDAANNTVTSFTGTVTFGGTGGFTGNSAAFTAGVLSSVSVTPTVAGSNITFTVNDGASHTGSATIATINPGSVASFAISTISGTKTAGSPITGITITAKDALGNTATGFTGTVTFGGTGGFSGTSEAFTAGVLSSVSATPTVAGNNLTFTVNDGASHTGSATIATINPGAVASFAISTISGTQTVGTPITGITLTAKDASGNTATGFSGTVTFGGTGGFTGTSAAFIAGARSSVSVTPTVAGNNLTFTVNDGASHTGSATIATIASVSSILTWDANALSANQSDGAGGWLTSNQWWNGSSNSNWISGGKAVFGNGGVGGAVSLTAPTTVESLGFNSFTGTYTLGTALQTISVNGGITVNSGAGAVTILSPITLGASQTWTTNSTNALTVSGAISGSASLTKSGSGTVILNPSSDTSDYGGVTNITNGVLNIRKSNALGSVAAGTNVSSGAALELQGTVSVGAESLTLNGSGVANAGALRNIVNSNSFAGLVTLTGASRINSDAGTLTLSNTGTITGEGLSLTVGGAGNVNIQSTIGTTTGSLVKDGPGALTLYGTNTYSGGTILSGGTINFGTSATDSLGAATSSVTLTANSTLGMSGLTTFQRSFILNNNAMLRLLNGNSGITITGPVTGSGGIIPTGAGQLNQRFTTLASTANTFTGPISNPINGNCADLIVNSLRDVVGAGNITFGENGLSRTMRVSWGAGANSALVLNSRQIVIIGATTKAILSNFNTTASNSFTVNTNLLNSTTGTATLELGGTNSGNNTFAGLISNGSGGGSVSVAKADTGKWVLSGNNTYSGTTNVTSGKLFINGNQTAASGAVNVSLNATLGGTGILGGNTTIAASGRLEFNISTSASSHDKLELAANKTLTFSGSSQLIITSTGGASPGTYTLISGGNYIVGTTPTLILPNGWGGTVSISGNSLLLNLTSIAAAAPISAFAEWSGSAEFVADSNADGVSDAIAWALGAPDTTIDATPLLPTGDAVSDPDYYIFTYRRSDAANAEATITAQYTDDLTTWTTAVDNAVDIFITTFDDFYGANIDKVEVKIKRTLAADGRLFHRLSVTP